MATILQRCHRSSVVSNIPINALAQFSSKRLLAAVSGGYDLQLSKHNNNRSTTSYLRHQTYSSTSYNQHKVSDEGSNTTDLHSLYHDQMKEIQSERESIFGKESEDDPSNQSPDLSQTAKSYFTSSNDSTSTSQQQSLQQPTSDATTTPQIRPPNWNAEEYEAAATERDALYDFSDEEKSAWSSNGTETLSSLHMLKIREMIRQAPDETADSDTSPKESETTTQQTSQFSHLTPQGDGVSMVDVGHKVSSRRVATARSVVVFPPEVMSAFQVSDNEMVGPKGPLFETAKIAGIMGAKKTSDLIPLCHPLPLDRVNINIQLIHNQAIIECECRVTHKTGVEMEALTGASIAALTIYDMVKAVSHKVEIGQTILVNKSGGKSDYNFN